MPALIISLLDTSDRSDAELTLDTGHTVAALITTQRVQMRSRARYTTWTNTSNINILSLDLLPNCYNNIEVKRSSLPHIYKICIVIEFKTYIANK